MAEGSKGGFFYVLNAVNGSKVPGFTITETPTYDPSGKGIALNGFYKTQPFPTGASFCMAMVDYSPAGLAKCNFPGNPLTDEYGVGLGNTDQQPDPGDEPVERVADRRRTGVGGALLRAVPRLRRRRRRRDLRVSAVGVQPADDTRTTRACRTSRVLTPTRGRRRPNVNTVSAPLTNGVIGWMSAINLTNNTMRWQFAGQANGLGDCYSGSLATGGNLVFTLVQGPVGRHRTCPTRARRSRVLRRS